MTNVEKMFAKLDSMGLRLGGVTPGPDATTEGMAAEILASLERLEAGDFEEIIIE